MLTEKSAGAVVFRRDNGIRYLLLQYNYKSLYWDFSKGNIEQKETPEGTVRREVKEETGITDMKFVPGFQEKITWFYKRGNENIHKEVIYFLVETREKDIRISKEHLDAGWFTYEEAAKKMKFDNSKKVLKKANEFLKGGLGKYL